MTKLLFHIDEKIRGVKAKSHFPLSGLRTMVMRNFRITHVIEKATYSCLVQRCDPGKS